MEVARIHVSGVSTWVTDKNKITSGMVGAKVVFDFDDTWDGLNKTAVFKCGSVTRDVVGIDTVSDLPPEVITKSGDVLFVGVYGTDGKAEVVIPTVWTSLGRVLPGADPSGDESTNPDLSVWAQIMELIGDLSNLTTEARENLVEAINEAHALADSSADMMNAILTQEQLELLNAMLIQDTLICFPVINASYTIENTGNLDGYTQEWTVNAVISDIDKALIQKVEVGAGESRMAPNGVQYKWFDAKLILGETEHTAVCSGPGYNGYPPHGFVVKLTYYSTIGGTNELTKEAVKAE